MIHVVHEAESGRLVSWTADAARLASAEILAARGYAVTQRPDGEQTGAWNPATLRFDPRPPAPAVLTPLQWTLRFTAAERIAIRAACETDPVLHDIMDLVDKASEIDPADPLTVQGVGYLVQLGLLTESRAAEVLG